MVPPLGTIPAEGLGISPAAARISIIRGKTGNQDVQTRKKGTRRGRRGRRGGRTPGRDGVVGSRGCFLGCGGLGWTGRRRESGASIGGTTKERPKMMLGGPFGRRNLKKGGKYRE